MSKWTNEQLLAINSEGKNIIVSAGAGSGKTAVLSERVLRKINDNVPINKLLILTFTNEAAKEMKDRIRKKLINEKKSDQLNLLEESYITTFDSYSLYIVKKYHYLLNVSKDIKIIDDTIISNLKDKFIDEIFEELYKNEDEKFLKLINDFCLKDDRNIKEMILNISKKIDLKIDKELYLRNYINEFYNDENVEKLYLEYKKLIDKKLSNISYLLDLFSNYSDSDYYEKVYNLVYPLINAKTYEEYNLYKNITLPRTTKLDEDAKKVKEELNKEIKSLVSIIIYDDEKSAKESIYLTKPYVDIIIKIISLLDEKIKMSIFVEEPEVIRDKNIHIDEDLLSPLIVENPSLIKYVCEPSENLKCTAIRWDINVALYYPTLTEKMMDVIDKYWPKYRSQLPNYTRTIEEDNNNVTEQISESDEEKQ